MITLKNILRANAASCIIFGALFIIAPLKIAIFLGGDDAFPELVLLSLGAVLIINGVHLIWASFQEAPNKFLILYFSLGDFLWAIGSAVLLSLGLWITTTIGIIATILVAVIVTVFGVLQIIKRREMCNIESK